MAGLGNMTFYEKHFDLAQWFAHDHLLYDTGDIPSKPDPAIYLKALNLLGVAPEDCMELNLRDVRESVLFTPLEHASAMRN
jgi:phosphoglycolate phosphatase-like HAD superfamily hydrolase